MSVEGIDVCLGIITTDRANAVILNRPIKMSSILLCLLDISKKYINFAIQ
jgi:hypothetical protein